MKRILNLTIWITGLALVAAGIYLFIFQLHFVTDPGSDYMTYYAASRNLLEGRSIYTDPNAQSPFLAPFFVPFALLLYPHSAIAWSIVSLISYVGLAWVVKRSLKLDLPPNVLIALTGLLLIWYPFQSNIFVGQVSIFLAMLLVAGWALIRSGHDRWGGVLLGMAVAIKLFPAIVLFFLLARKKLHAAVAMGVSSLAFGLGTLAIVGWADCRYFIFDMVLGPPSVWVVHPINISLRGIINRLFAEGLWVREVSYNPTLANILFAAGALAVVAIFIWQLIRFPHSTDGDDRLYSATMIAMMLLSPITWPHIIPVLLFPLGILLKELLEKRSLWMFRLLLLETILFSIPTLKIFSLLVAKYEPYLIPWAQGLVFIVPTLIVISLWVLISVKVPYLAMREAGQQAPAEA